MRTWLAVVMTVAFIGPAAAQDTASRGTAEHVSAADSAALVNALAAWLTSDTGPRREPFAIRRSGRTLEGAKWSARVDSALHASGSERLVREPVRTTPRVAFYGVTFANDTATVRVAFESCREDTSIQHSSFITTYQFARSSTGWIVVPETRRSGIVGDSLRCPW